MRKKATPRLDSVMRFRLAILLGCLPALVVPTMAEGDLCGATIVWNLKLDHDLTCLGDGLIVGADGIKIDLAGYTITGSGSGAAVVVTGRTNVTIAGGTVRNFAAGVFVSDSSDIVIKGNEFRQNVDGIDCQAGCVGNTIKENEFGDNTARGIMLRGSSVDNVVKENTFTGNRVGILLFGATDSTVKENIVSGNIIAGIRVNVLATGNLLKENTVSSNPAGIEFLRTATGSATGNTVVENTLATNACGLKGPLAGNTVRKNLFETNIADICP